MKEYTCKELAAMNDEQINAVTKEAHNELLNAGFKASLCQSGFYFNNADTDKANADVFNAFEYVHEYLEDHAESDVFKPFVFSKFVDSSVEADIYTFHATIDELKAEITRYMK